MVRTANVQSEAMPVSTVSKLLQRKARMMLSSVKSAVIFVPMMKNHWYLSKEQGIRMRIEKMSASRLISVPNAGKRSKRKFLSAESSITMNQVFVRYAMMTFMTRRLEIVNTKIGLTGIMTERIWIQQIPGNI